MAKERCVICGMPGEEEIEGVTLCNRCYETHQDGLLKIIREDDQVIIMQKTEDGWTHRAIPLVEDRPVPLYELGEWSYYLQNVRRILQDASEETLREYFWELERMEGATFVARCSIVHELYERAQVNDSIDERAALRYVARALEISYDYARKLHSVYENIVAPLEAKQEEIPEIPAGFFVEAAKRAKKYGVDPVKAVKYAAERLAEDRSYRRNDFVADLKAGLPEASLPEPQEPPPSCMNCIHMKKAGSDCKLLLMRGDKIIAEGPGKGIYYCELAEATKDEILEYTDLFTQAEKCRKEGRYVRRQD